MFDGIGFDEGFSVCSDPHFGHRLVSDLRGFSVVFLLLLSMMRLLRMLC